MPNEEELKAMKHKQDLIALVDSLSKIKRVEIKQAATDTVAKIQELPDLLRDETAKKLFGSFYKGALGTEEFTTLENEKIKVTLNNKGGKIYSVELKEYKTFDLLPVVLFKGDSAVFALRFTE